MANIKNASHVSCIARKMEMVCLSETERADQSLNMGEEFMMLLYMLFADSEIYKSAESFHPPPKNFLTRTCWTDVQRLSCRGVGFQTSS
jgi:hypothetical protein